MFYRLIVLFLILTACSEDPYVSEIETWRENRNQEFKSYASPIPEFKRSYFEGLKYYDIDPLGKITGEFKILQSSDSISFVVNTSKTVFYQKKGLVSFVLNGENIQLLALEDKSRGEDALFIPFADATSGVFTYGSGRYIYTKIENDNSVVLDFNKAINPHCAYNDAFVCMPAPDENIIPFNIEFGEKIYQNH